MTVTVTMAKIIQIVKMYILSGCIYFYFIFLPCIYLEQKNV